MPLKQLNLSFLPSLCNLQPGSDSRAVQIAWDCTVISLRFVLKIGDCMDLLGLLREFLSTAGVYDLLFSTTEGRT